MNSNIAKIQRRLLPHMFEDAASETPEQVALSLSSKYSEIITTQDVTFSRLAKAIDRAAWWLQERLGTSNTHDTIAYVAGSGVRNILLTVAAVKTGYTILFLSPRNSVEAQVHLLRMTNCKALLRTLVPVPGIPEVLTRYKAIDLVVPALEEWLDGPDVSRYPYNRMYEDAKDEPVLLFHTSGSTGLPKTVTWRHTFFTCMIIQSSLPAPSGRKTASEILGRDRERAFLPMPLFHAGGFGMTVRYIFAWGAIPVFPSSAAIPTPSMVEYYITHDLIKSAVLPPFLIESMAKNPMSLESLGKLRYLLTGSAPISTSLGSLVRSKTIFMTLVGSTEMECPPYLTVDAEDWQYQSPHPDAGIEFRAHEDSGLHEMVVVKREGLDQPPFTVFPHLKEFRTRDLYRRHPDPAKSDLWLYEMREDDLIVFSNGEKLNPLSMEDHINSHPKILSAIVVGQRRFQSALLLEAVTPPTSKAETMNLLEEVWPTIEAANENCPRYGRVSKMMVIIATKEKPFLRAGKGSVQRKFTLDLYKTELEALYSSEGKTNSTYPSTDVGSPELDSLLLKIVCEVTQSNDMKGSDNFFINGMDSLQVAQLARILESTIKRAGEPIGIETGQIYAHPSVEQICIALRSQDHRIEDLTSQDEAKRVRIEDMLKKFALTQSGSAQKNNGPMAVLLTGSTGSLGSYLLATLLSQPVSKVRKIYCLNRGADAAVRQKKLNELRHLPMDLDPERVVFLHGDFFKLSKSLPKPDFDGLVKDVTHIIHNAWVVDFNLSLESFEQQLAGVHEIIKLTNKATHQVQISFISSIGAVHNWHAAGYSGLVPEKIIDDPMVAEPIGYGESKYVAERMLSAAGVSGSVIRIGQIAGSIQHSGLWNLSEWLPSLVMSSKKLRLLPDGLGASDAVDWLPVDMVADMVLDLMKSMDNGLGLQVHHLVNPNVISWRSLVPLVQRHLGKDVKVVSYEKWLLALEDAASSKQGQALKEIPAIKLLDFFKGLARSAQSPKLGLDTSITRRASKRLTACGPVTEAWMTKWMEEWGL